MKTIIVNILLVLKHFKTLIVVTDPCLTITIIKLSGLFCIYVKYCQFVLLAYISMFGLGYHVVRRIFEVILRDVVQPLVY